MSKSNAAGVMRAVVMGGSAIGALLLFPKVAKAATAAKAAAPGNKGTAFADSLLGRNPSQQQQQPASKGSSPGGGSLGGGAPRASQPSGTKSGVKFGIPTNLGKLGQIFALPFSPYTSTANNDPAPYFNDGLLGGPLAEAQAAQQTSLIESLFGFSTTSDAVLASADVESLPLGGDYDGLIDYGVELAGVEMDAIPDNTGGDYWSQFVEYFAPEVEIAPVQFEDTPAPPPTNYFDMFDYSYDDAFDYGFEEWEGGY